MDKEQLQKLAGIITEEDRLSTMTREAMKDVEKSVDHFYDRMLTDGMGDMEARRVLNRLLESLM